MPRLQHRHTYPQTLLPAHSPAPAALPANAPALLLACPPQLHGGAGLQRPPGPLPPPCPQATASRSRAAWRAARLPRRRRWRATWAGFGSGSATRPCDSTPPSTSRRRGGWPACARGRRPRCAVRCQWSRCSRSCLPASAVAGDPGFQSRRCPGERSSCSGAAAALASAPQPLFYSAGQALPWRGPCSSALPRPAPLCAQAVHPALRCPAPLCARCTAFVSAAPTRLCRCAPFRPCSYREHGGALLDEVAQQPTLEHLRAYLRGLRDRWMLRAGCAECGRGSAAGRAACVVPFAARRASCALRPPGGCPPCVAPALSALNLLGRALSCPEKGPFPVMATPSLHAPRARDSDPPCTHIAGPRLQRPPAVAGNHPGALAWPAGARHSWPSGRGRGAWRRRRRRRRRRRGRPGGPGRGGGGRGDATPARGRRGRGRRQAAAGAGRESARAAAAAAAAQRQRQRGRRRRRPLGQQQRGQRAQRQRGLRVGERGGRW